MELAEKQFDLAKRVRLQPGLLAYISLHCVEASSLLLSTSDSDSEYESNIHKRGLWYAKIAKE